ncbi:MAG: YHS domain-containing protein [Deltaproteobacteria bacterium]|nr:YHS domain-containing protein [Deltaproteobacteria bacterium]
MRLLIVGALIYLGYRLAKIWLLPGKSTKRTRGEGGLTAIDDVMVKDPFCGTYFPEQKGVKGVIEGKAYNFCSTQCRDRFLESASDAKESTSH